MEKWVGKVAVVTGASSGIGAAISVALANSGMIVIGLARRESKVEDLKRIISNTEGQLHPRRCDVANLDEVTESFRWIEETFGGVNVLVNNAGRGANGPILDDELSRNTMDIVNLNLMGVIYCTKAAFDILERTDDIGYIINMSSVAGHIVMNFDPNAKTQMGIYAATKHAIRAATETLRLELQFANNKNIRLSMISPGLVKTEILTASYANIPDDIYELLPALEPEDIANTLLHIISTPPRVQIHDVIIKPTGEKF